MNIPSLTSSLFIAFACLLTSVNAQSIQYTESPVEYTYVPVVIYSSYEVVETQPIAWVNSSPTYHNNTAMIVSTSNAISVEPSNAIRVEPSNPIVVKDRPVPVAQATKAKPVEAATPSYSVPIAPYVPTAQWHPPVCMSGG